jgi:hypothetical protein
VETELHASFTLALDGGSLQSLSPSEKSPRGFLSRRIDESRCDLEEDVKKKKFVPPPKIEYSSVVLPVATSLY